MKKRLLVFLAVLLVLAACTPGALAYDVAAEQAENFGTASLESALPEQAYDAFGTLSVADAAQPQSLLAKLWAYVLREGGGAVASAARNAALLLAVLLGFDLKNAASIAVIGAADGPTSIMVSQILKSDYIGAIAVAAYSYMSLVPIIQPPIMKLLTSKEERKIMMKQPRYVSRLEKIAFPVVMALIVNIFLPPVAPLITMLMLGNLLRECGVTDRLSDTAQNALCNIVTIFLGLSVGCKAIASTFLTWETIKIIILGLIAFTFSTVGSAPSTLIAFTVSFREPSEM